MVAGCIVAFSVVRRDSVVSTPVSSAASEPGATHAVLETQLSSDEQAREFARENAVAFERWILLPPGALFAVTPSRDVTVTALGDGNKPSWAGTWTVAVTSNEVPKFRQLYTQSMTFGPGAADQPSPRTRHNGGLSDATLYERLGKLPKAARIALLGLIAAQGNPTLLGFDQLSVDVGQTSGLTDKQRFFRDRLLALGIANGFSPTRVLWLSFDDPSAPDGTPHSLLMGYSAKTHGYTVLASSHGVYDGKLVTAK